MNLARAFVDALHPAANPEHIVGLGALIPEWAPAGGEVEAGSADAVLVAPSPTECDEAGWWDRAFATAARLLAVDGVLYIIPPRRWRLRVTRMIAEAGLAAGPVFAHPGGDAPRLYAPLYGPALRHAALAFGLPPRWRRLGRWLDLFPFTANLLLEFLPSVGIAATRPATQPMGWLGLGTGSRAIVSTSWRGESGGAIVMAFARDAVAPQFVAKRPSGAGKGAGPDEAGLLRELGGNARKAGLNPPIALDIPLPTGWWAQSCVEGKPLANALAGGGMHAQKAILRVADHLEAWSRLTLQTTAFTPDVADTVLEPARMLARCGAIDRAYLEALEAAAKRLLDREIMLVAAHNDCTGANLLVNPDGEFSLVDWETACPSGLPLADFWYSACDMVAATRGLHDRPAAFASCFTSSGAHWPIIRKMEERLSEAVGLPETWADLCFHLCWLHHAANEQFQTRDDEPRPFLEMARMAYSQGVRPLDAAK